MFEIVLVPPTSLVLDAVLKRRADAWQAQYSEIQYGEMMGQSSPYEHPMVDFRTGLVIDGTGLVHLALDMKLPLMPVVFIDAGDSPEVRT